MRRHRRILAVGAVLAAALPLAGFLAWPSLLEGFARGKLEQKLEAKFDHAGISCFELERSSLEICDLRLEKDSITVDVEKVAVNFEVLWGFSPQVAVEHVLVEKGFVAGEFEDFQSLRSSSSGKDGGTAASKTLVLEEAGLRLEDLRFNVERGGWELSGQLDASAPSPRGPVAVEVSRAAVRRGDELLGKAGSLQTTLDLEKSFPLYVALEDASTEFGDFPVTGVGGAVLVQDQALEKIRVDLHGQTDAGQSWSLEGDVDRAQKAVDVVLAAEDIRPSQLPGAQSLPLDPERGTVSGSLSLRGSRKKVHLEGDLRVEDLQIMHSKVARRPVIVNNRVTVDGTVDLEDRMLLLKRATISPLEKKNWALVLRGEARHAVELEDRHYELEATLEDAPCQELLEAAPAGLLPALEKFELGGTTGGDLEVVMDLSDPDATVLRGGIDLDRCRIKKVPPTLAALEGTFNHVIKMKNGHSLSKLLSRGASGFTPFDQVPSSLPAAVLSSEDGGFWRHDGFIKSQFRASLKRNLELGTIRRGASTITMQMVKNVLLTHERTFSRKLQELFLTWVVERRLSKGRILEIYLNVVEFGPGIYGVTEAADHYFGKTPLELTSLESAFLATLLPRPIERHEMWCRGSLTERHSSYVKKIHRRMLARGGITQAEFDAAEAAPFVFSRRGWGGEKACIAAGRRVAEGKYTQGALTGLLLGRPEEGPPDALHGR